jgi:outer membrane lipoprotein-sorting protein
VTAAAFVACWVGTARLVAQAPAPQAAAPADAPPSPEALAKGAALLADARKAIGGEDRLRAVKTLQSTGKFRRTQGNNTIDGDVEVFIQLPDKYRRNEVTGQAGAVVERTEVLNGTEVWDENAGGFGGLGGFGRGRFGGGFPPDGRGRQGGQPQIDPERLKDAQRRQRQGELARLTLLWLLSTDAPVAWIGTAESPDGKADVVEVKPADGAATRIFLDTESHLPVMLTTTQAFGGRGGQRRGGGPDGRAGAPAAPPPAGDQAAAPAAGPGQGRRGGQQGPPQPITIETHLSEYKAVGGIKLPHLMTRGANGQTNEEWEVKSFKINPNFKGNTFTK